MTSPHSPIAPSAAFRGKSGVSAYADFLIETDWCVGEILKAVDESGIADNTLVFFTCDNGTSAPHADFPKLEAKGVHLRDSYRGAKSDVFEGGHRVPFIARWPGKIKAGGRSDEPICTTDFMRTVAEVAGCELPDNAAEDSFSLWPILSGKAETIPDRAGIVNHSIKGHFAVRKGSWKLLFTAGSGGWSNPSEAQARAKKFPPIQLYNLADDPKEQRNLQAEHPELVQELTKTLQTIVDNGRSTPGSTQANDGKNWWWQLPWEEPASN